MALPLEVAQTIRALDRKIRLLEETKQRLIAAFASDSAQESSVRLPPVPTRNGGSSGTRLMDFLRAHGPATRQEIVESAHVPNGSISWLMKKYPRIRRREDGRIELAQE